MQDVASIQQSAIIGCIDQRRAFEQRRIVGDISVGRRRFDFVAEMLEKCGRARLVDRLEPALSVSEKRRAVTDRRREVVDQRDPVASVRVDMRQALPNIERFGRDRDHRELRIDDADAAARSELPSQRACDHGKLIAQIRIGKGRADAGIMLPRGNERGLRRGCAQPVGIAGKAVDDDERFRLGPDASSGDIVRRHDRSSSIAGCCHSAKVNASDDRSDFGGLQRGTRVAGRVYVKLGTWRDSADKSLRDEIEVLGSLSATYDATAGWHWVL